MCVHVIVVASHCEFLVDKGAITHSHTEHIKVVYCDGDEANEQNQTAVVRHSFWPWKISHRIEVSRTPRLGHSAICCAVMRLRV